MQRNEIPIPNSNCFALKGQEVNGHSISTNIFSNSQSLIPNPKSEIPKSQ